MKTCIDTESETPHPGLGSTFDDPNSTVARCENRVLLRLGSGKKSALGSPNKPSALERGALERCSKIHKIDPEWIRRFRNRWLKRGLAWQEALQPIPAEVQARWRDELGFETLELLRRADSEADGASKLLWQDAQDRRFETVVMRIQSGRNTVCVSSQFGCAVGCRFCATGLSQNGQSLEVGAILQQVLAARQLLQQEGRSLRNVVFMGMGEPFLNFEAVSHALQNLCDPQHFALSPRHVLVSTVGIPAAMREFARRFPRVPLALSLHAAIQSRREALMPIAKRHDLPDLAAALRDCNKLQEHPVMLEYLLLRGQNDDEQDLAALIRFCRPLRVRINLIPYNPVQGLEFRGSSKSTLQRFQEGLKVAGLEVTVRRSLGSDISAACGQLLRRENQRLRLSRL